MVTGATGFIGSHLVQKLEDQDFDLISIVSPADIGTKTFPKNSVIEFADLTDYDKVKSIVLKHRPDILVHLGAVTPVRFSFELPEIYQQVNHFATVNLVHSALKIENFEKFIFASTAETYGWQKHREPFIEDLPLNPASPYAVSKVAAENYIKMAGIAYSLPHIVMRPCNTFGRKNDTGFIVEYLITSMLRGVEPWIGTPDAVRDLMYVDDHVGAYLKAIKFNLPDKEERVNFLKNNINEYVFNFGLGFEFTIFQIAEKIKSMTGYNGQFVFKFPPNYPWRPVFEDYISLNAEKAKKILGWEPKFTLEDGLKSTLAFWKEMS